LGTGHEHRHRLVSRFRKPGKEPSDFVTASLELVPDRFALEQQISREVLSGGFLREERI
jgi:hypothetical protein